MGATAAGRAAAGEGPADGGALRPAGLDADAAYRALAARDPRFDGRVWFGVTTTGIYCRPVCPAQTPRPTNVRFFADPAAAVSAGFRACRRCRPDAAPGSRHWDHRGDLAARALRLVAAGVVDDEGVGGLAARLHVSERHVHRTLIAEVGVGPLQLAISRRAQTARLLIDSTELPLADVAFAAGFSSVRQFNDVMRREFGVAPSALRGRREPSLPAEAPALVLRLPWRGAYDLDGVGSFLGARALAGSARHLPSGAGWTHARTLPLPHGTAVVEAQLGPTTRRPHGSATAAGHAVVRLRGADLRDTSAAVDRVRRWLDLDADPAAIGATLGGDPWLAPLMAAAPGVRVVGSPDPFEGLARAIVGQQVSVAAAGTMLARVVAALGRPAGEGLTAFPSAEAVAGAEVPVLRSAGLTGGRARALQEAAAAVASGALDLEPGADRAHVRSVLLAITGIGPWTADYVALRVLGDPDAFPSGDLALRRSAAALGYDGDLVGRAGRWWRPWRAYAATLLWRHDGAAPEGAPA